MAGSLEHLQFTEGQCEQEQQGDPRNQWQGWAGNGQAHLQSGAHGADLSATERNAKSGKQACPWINKDHFLEKFFEEIHADDGEQRAAKP
jgi:hypothetical protein